jgi:hypothetical protein
MNYKNTEEIQWEDIDAKELKDVKISFQALPKKLADLKNENANNDFLVSNENDDIPDNLEKNLEAIFDIDSKKDNSVCNKTNQTEEKDFCLNTSQTNNEDKILSENTNDDSKKDKFSLFSDLSLFNRNNENLLQSIPNQINPQNNIKEFVTHFLDDKNNIVNDNTQNSQNTFENSKIFENVCYLENPVALIKKNLLSKNWFVTKNEKLIQCFTSYELFKFLENEVNKQKEISSYWVFDNETDIHFTAIAIYDNLKDNIIELMKELQNNYHQQNMMKNKIFLNSFPPNMMFNPNSPKTQDIGKVPVIPPNVPIFQPFPPQMMPPINNRFMPPPMFMPIPGNFMMNFAMNTNMNIQREKVEEQFKSTIINNVPNIETNLKTTKIGK